MNKSEYISTLPQETQEQLLQDVKAALEQYSISEQSHLVEEAMNSRLIDLEELINIDKYMK